MTPPTRCNVCGGTPYLELPCSINAFASGNMVAHGVDIAKFAYLLFTGRLVSKASAEEMLQLRSEDYGMGVAVPPLVLKDTQTELHNMYGYGHSGFCSGFNAGAIYIPGLNASFA